ncbi:MAG TPA: hypothetical protein VN756_00765 [Solirubrobacterales bacterium]|nr:hypothetical protein [Solirubrobacterales bacterium]
MSDMPFTIRIEDGLELLSNDQGETWRLDPKVASQLRQLCGVLMEEQPLGFGAETAALRGGLAEAEGISPRANGEADNWRGASSEASGVCLGGLVLPQSRALSDVLDQRVSERCLAPPTLSEVATVLVRGGRVRDWYEVPGGHKETRALPSAGACNPIELHVLTTKIPGLDAGWWRFDPLRCELHAFDSGAEAFDAISEDFEARGFDLVGGYTAIFTVAEFARTLNRYPAGGSLVWRDAGVALGGLHLCASDIGLASCIVAGCGMLGSNIPGALDVGALLLGHRPSPSQ